MAHTYIIPRLFHYITAFLWATAATFFRLWIQAAIMVVCPQGKLSALGGKSKRNIQTLGRAHGQDGELEHFQHFHFL